MKAKGEVQKQVQDLEEQLKNTQSSLQRHKSGQVARDLDAMQTAWRRDNRQWAKEKTDLLEQQQAETAALHAKRDTLQEEKNQLLKDIQALQLQALSCGWCSGRKRDKGSKGGNKGDKDSKGDKGGKGGNVGKTGS